MHILCVCVEFLYSYRNRGLCMDVGPFTPLQLHVHFRKWKIPTQVQVCLVQEGLALAGLAKDTWEFSHFWTLPVDWHLG